MSKILHLIVGCGALTSAVCLQAHGTTIACDVGSGTSVTQAYDAYVGAGGGNDAVFTFEFNTWVGADFLALEVESPRVEPSIEFAGYIPEPLTRGRNLRKEIYHKARDAIC